MNKYFLLGIGILVVVGFAYTLSGKPVAKPQPESVKTYVERRPRRESDKVALFAGGCFWSLESYFEKVPEGIVDVVSGYSGGKTENPTYQDYAAGGHREVVQVTYDPAIISYEALTEYFFRHIDPTDAGGSFYDRGLNYTSAIYHESNEEKKVAEDIITIINKEKIFTKPIVAAVLPSLRFWPAEDEHQNYARNNSQRYTSYRIGSGRDAFLEKIWEGRGQILYKK